MGGAETERGTIGGLLYRVDWMFCPVWYILWVQRVRRRAVRDGAVEVPRFWLPLQH